MGLAPIVVNDLFAAIRGLHKSGLTIIIVEQKAFLTLKMVDFAHVVVHGHISASGTGRELLNSDAVQASYLGKGDGSGAARPVSVAAPVVTGGQATAAVNLTAAPAATPAPGPSIAPIATLPPKRPEAGEAVDIASLGLTPSTTTRLRWPRA